MGITVHMMSCSLSEFVLRDLSLESYLAGIVGKVQHGFSGYIVNCMEILTNRVT